MSTRGYPGRTPKLRVLMIASEASPWAKTGGLADVVGALPRALVALGHAVTTVVPQYTGVTPPPAARIVRRTVQVGTVVHDVAYHVAAQGPDHQVVFVGVPTLFDRDGFYGSRGREFEDNAERFAMLSAAALDFAEHDGGDPVDVVHAHDWQAGLAAALVKADPVRYARTQQAAFVFTIHNLAYQGLFDKAIVPRLGLPWSVFTLDTGEFWGQFSFLKTGIAYSDYLTTVSPTYARETQGADFGCGMEGVLASRASRYVGILNGIDTDTWNPASDSLIPAPFDARDLTGKRACKHRLLERFRVATGDDALARPVVGLVSRLVDQKGIGIIAEAQDALAALEATWIFVGQGEPRFEEFLRGFAAAYPARVGVHVGFDEPLAHLVEAGSDMFLMPSKFEPCGLNQMYSLRYGTVPIVRAVGGLDDTVQPYTARARHANGFKFAEASADALVRTLRQALRLFRDKAAWSRLVREGMAADHSWETSAREYVRVYRRARHAVAYRGIR